MASQLKFKQHKKVERQVPGDSKWPFYPLVGGHDSPLKVSLKHPEKVTKNRLVLNIFLGTKLIFDIFELFLFQLETWNLQGAVGVAN